MSKNENNQESNNEKNTYHLGHDLPEIPSSPAFPMVEIQPTPSSVAIESLIQQNMDLTTRLNINLRRVAELENVIHSYGEQSQYFQQQKSAFQEEVQVLQKRFQNLETRALSYKIDKENAEKAYAHLVMDQKSNRERLTQENNYLKNQITTFARYRTRIQSQISPLFKAYREDSLALQKTEQNLKRHLKYRKNMQSKITPLFKEALNNTKIYKTKIETLELQQLEAQKVIQRFKSEIQQMQEEHDEDQKRLVMYHETRSRQTEINLENTQAELKSTKKRLGEEFDKREQVETELLKANNKTLEVNRQYEDLFSSAETEIHALKNEVTHSQELWKKASILNEQKDIQIRSMQKVNEKLQIELRELREQVQETKKERPIENTPPPEILFAPRKSIPQSFIETDVERISDLLAQIQSGHTRREVETKDSEIAEREDFGDFKDL